MKQFQTYMYEFYRLHKEFVQDSMKFPVNPNVETENYRVDLFPMIKGENSREVYVILKETGMAVYKFQIKNGEVVYRDPFNLDYFWFLTEYFNLKFRLNEKRFTILHSKPEQAI